MAGTTLLLVGVVLVVVVVFTSWLFMLLISGIGAKKLK